MLKDKEKYEIIRELIQHEDSLVNQRITWYLVMEGILFAAAGVVAKDLLDFPQRTCLLSSHGIAFALTMLSIFGIYGSILVWILTGRAFYQSHAAGRWWIRQNIKGFPPISGEWKYDFLIVVALGVFPIAVAVFWIVVLRYALSRM